jgi:hypothetical protein
MANDVDRSGTSSKPVSLMASLLEGKDLEWFEIGGMSPRVMRGCGAHPGPVWDRSGGVGEGAT